MGGLRVSAQLRAAACNVVALVAEGWDGSSPPSTTATPNKSTAAPHHPPPSPHNNTPAPHKQRQWLPPPTERPRLKSTCPFSPRRPPRSFHRAPPPPPPSFLRSSQLNCRAQVPNMPCRVGTSLPSTDGCKDNAHKHNKFHVSIACNPQHTDLAAPIFYSQCRDAESSTDRRKKSSVTLCSQGGKLGEQ